MKKIIEELHDQFLPNLMSMIYAVEYWEKSKISPEFINHLKRIKIHLNEAVKESRKLLMHLKPPRIVEKSLPKALNYYLNKLSKTKGLEYKWITSPPLQDRYKNEDALLIIFLELIANIPTNESVLFAFNVSLKDIQVAFSWEKLKRKWLSGKLKNILKKRLDKIGGKLFFKKEDSKIWLVVNVPQ